MTSGERLKIGHEKFRRIEKKFRKPTKKFLNVKDFVINLAPPFLKVWIRCARYYYSPSVRPPYRLLEKSNSTAVGYFESFSSHERL